MGSEHEDDSDADPAADGQSGPERRSGVDAAAEGGVQGADRVYADEQVEGQRLVQNLGCQSGRDEVDCKCWYVHNLLKYEFDLQFEIPVTYPATAPELELPQLDGKTHKMYRGGKICLTVHFKPLWAKNSPRFGTAHALCLGLAPWLAAEIPILVDSGMIKHKDDTPSTSESS